MNIFLTGATGFLGGKLVTQLLAKGHHVYLLARNMTKAETLKSRFTIEERQRITIVQGDIIDKDFGLPNAFFENEDMKIDVFYHLAALVKFDLDLHDELHAINHGGTIHALDVAKKLGVKKFFHVSTAYTIGVEGNGKENLYPTTQRFHNPYEASKAKAEHAVMACKDEMEVSIFRPAIIVGDSITGEADSTFTLYGFLRAIEVFKRRISRRGELEPAYHLIGTKSGTSNLVPVDYVSNILSLAIDSAQPNQIYNITNPAPPTNEYLLNKVKNVLDFHALKIVEPKELESVHLKQYEAQLNEMIGVFRPYLETHKVFCDRNTQKLLKQSDIEHLSMDDEMIDRIFAAAL